MVGIGLLFPRQAAALAAWTTIILGIQMFLMGLSVRMEAVGQALRRPRYLIIWCGLAWGLMPAVSFLLGRVFLYGSPEFAAGLILTTALPAAITSNVWTGISRGNLPLAIAIVGAASVLSGLITPLILSLWVGVFVKIDAARLFLGFLYSVMAPTLAGIGAHEALLSRMEPAQPALRLTVKVLIGLVIAINAGVLHPYLATWGWSAAKILALVILQALLIYALMLIALPRLPGIGRGEVVALTYATSMRNNSAGIVIGLTYFGPTVAAPVILSILMQQPLASLVHRFIFNRPVAGAPASGLAPATASRR